MYGDRFVESCEGAGIPTRRITTAEALRYEPRINPETRSAIVVPDGTLDAYRLPLQFFATARANGGVVRSFCEVTGIESRGGAVAAIVVRDLRTGTEERHSADIVINAGGPWAGRIAACAGIDLPITPAPGTMVAVRRRLCNMIVSHLHPPGDGDIIVPQRGLSIIGSTQWETDHPDGVRTPEDDVEWLLARADDLMPGFSSEAYHAAWTAVRPLAGRSGAGGRGLSRDFQVLSHGPDRVDGFYSVTGGKATVLRAMAQQVPDVVSSDLGLDLACSTSDTPLLPHRTYFRRSA